MATNGEFHASICYREGDDAAVEMTGDVVAVQAVSSVASADESEAAHAPLGAQMIHGVNHAHMHRGDRGYGSARSAETLSDLRRLGAPSTPSPISAVNSDRLRGFPAEPGEAGARDDNDPSMADDDLAREIAAAHERGLKVLIKPHVWSRDFWGGSEWHGSIDQDTPETRRRWWRSYRQCVLHYARLAEAHGADGLCLGTELVKMTGITPICMSLARIAVSDSTATAA